MTHKLSKPPHDQNGSILVQFSLLIVVLITILGSVQIGYMYSAKRDLQRIADLAALESANAIKTATTCQNAQDAGEKSLKAQWPLSVTAQGEFPEMVICGSWSKSAGFSAAATTYNATKVTVTGKSLQLLPFTGNRIISATATAAIASDPIASFSIGSGVARLNAGVLNQLLTMLLGTNVNLSLVDYNGLANTNINLLGIVNALELNAGNYDELLNTKVSLKDLLNASIKVAENIADTETAHIAINAIGEILSLPVTVDLANTFISLLKGNGQNGLLDLGVYKNTPSSALQADVSALSILTTSLQIANANSAVALQTKLDLGILAKATLDLKIIEPPVIATGKAGKDEYGQYITTAHTGQARIKLQLNAVNSLNASGNLLDINLILLRLQVSLPSKTAIELPVYVEVGSAYAHLESISCNYYGHKNHKVTIGARPGVAHIFLGKAPDAMTNTTTAWENLSKDNFNLLNLNIKASLLADLITVLEAPVKLMAKVDISIENEKNIKNLDFKYSIDRSRSDQNLIQTVGSEKQLGASLGNAISRNLLSLQLDTSGLKILNIETKYLSAIVDGLVNSLSVIVGGVLSLLSTLLTPIFSLLDSILGPLLKALGLQIGYADVELLWADCNPAQLVY